MCGACVCVRACVCVCVCVRARSCHWLAAPGHACFCGGGILRPLLHECAVAVGGPLFRYVRKVAEVATQMFIAGDRPTVKGIVLAGVLMCLGCVELPPQCVFACGWLHASLRRFRFSVRACLALGLRPGSADFKTELQKSDLFDPRLLAIVIKVRWSRNSPWLA